MRWIIWSFLLVVTAGSGTLASRARNTSSYRYHAVAALMSHGTYFAGQIIGVNLLIEVIQTRSWSLALTGFLVYAGASTFGSLLSQWLAIHFFERGNSCRIGSYQ